MFWNVLVHTSVLELQLHTKYAGRVATKKEVMSKFCMHLLSLFRISGKATE